jgi:hypothetical protein
VVICEGGRGREGGEGEMHLFFRVFLGDGVFFHPRTQEDIFFVCEISGTPPWIVLLEGLEGGLT